MVMCWGRSSLDLVELVLDVDVFALAPCASVDCILEMLCEFCCRAVVAVGIFLAFPICYCCLTIVMIYLLFISFVEVIWHIIIGN